MPRQIPESVLLYLKATGVDHVSSLGLIHDVETAQRGRKHLEVYSQGSDNLCQGHAPKMPIKILSKSCRAIEYV